MFNPEAVRETNRKPITVEELARRELTDEARYGYFGNYSNHLLNELRKPLEQMTQRARYILDNRMEMIRSLEGKCDDEIDAEDD